MSNFNMTRFGHVLKADFATRRRLHLGVFLTSLVGGLGIGIFNYIKPSFMGPNIYMPGTGYETLRQLTGERLAESTANAFMVAFMLSFGYLLSLTFAGLRTRRERIAFAMLPASGAEKCLVRLLMHMLLFPLYVLAGLCLADLVRTALFPLFGHSYGSALPVFFHKITTSFHLGFNAVFTNSTGFDDFIGYAGIILFLLAYHFSYLFGSVLFRRRAFLFVMLIQVAALLIVGLSAANLAEYLLDNDVMKSHTLFRIYFVTGDVVLLAYLVGGFVWSYRHMTRLPVVSRRLFSLCK